jgi:hypothetical protein
MAMKVALGAAEVTGLALLIVLLRALGLPRARTAIYAWNPLVLVEVWGSAHLDALAVAAVVGAVLAGVKRRHTVAAVVLAVGTLVKLYPAFLLPLLVRAGGVRVLVPFAIVVALGYAPVLDRDGRRSARCPLRGRGTSIRTGAVDRDASGSRGHGGVGGRGRRRIARTFAPRGAADRWARPAGPNVFPWYALWLVPFLAVRRRSGGSPSPGRWGSRTRFLQPWEIPMWVRFSRSPSCSGGLVGRPAARGPLECEFTRVTSRRRALRSPPRQVTSRTGAEEWS